MDDNPDIATLIKETHRKVRPILESDFKGEIEGFWTNFLRSMLEWDMG